MKRKLLLLNAVLLLAAGLLIAFYFDQLYLTGLMTKDAAYQWLSDLLCTPPSEAHIGHLGEYYCKKVIAASKKLLEQRKQKQQHRRPVVCEGGAAS